MLSTSAVMGPVAPQATLNLQLQPTSSVALTQLMSLITSAGATVQSTTIPGLYQIAGASINMGPLAQQLSANPAVQYATPAQTVQIATVPNDPSFTNGTQWGLTAPGASTPPRPGTRPPARIR